MPKLCSLRTMPFAGTSVVANMLTVKQIQVMSPNPLAPPMSQHVRWVPNRVASVPFADRR